MVCPNQYLARFVGSLQPFLLLTCFFTPICLHIYEPSQNIGLKIVKILVQYFTILGEKKSIENNVLKAIGNTSLVQLRNIVPSGCGRIFVKLEWENPTGSMKDRMAQAMIASAETDGRLKPGDTIVEYTGGSTGISLALICVAKGYRLQIIRVCFKQVENISGDQR